MLSTVDSTNTQFGSKCQTMYRFKLSDWLKEGHMTWIIFDNVHVLELIHVC